MSDTMAPHTITTQTEHLLAPAFKTLVATIKTETRLAHEQATRLADELVTYNAQGEILEIKGRLDTLKVPVPHDASNPWGMLGKISAAVQATEGKVFQYS